MGGSGLSPGLPWGLEQMEMVLCYREPSLGQTSGGCNDKEKTIHAPKSLVQNENVCHKLWGKHDSQYLQSLLELISMAVIS